MIVGERGISDDDGDRYGLPRGIFSLFALLGFILTFRAFFGTLDDIWLFDEAYHINNGQLLLTGTLPYFCSNPLIAAFWALVSLPFRNNPHWMVQTYTAGRIIIYLLLWWSAFSVTKVLVGRVHQVVVLALLLVTPTLHGILDNSTDALFASLSAFALVRFIQYVRSSDRSRLVSCSILIGVSSLCRNDGLILSATMAMLAVGISSEGKNRLRAAAYSLIPTASIIFGYILVFGAVTGDWNSGIQRRSYDAFEQGQGMANFPADDGKNPYVEGYRESRMLYGSGEENRFSIVLAIRRNPAAFTKRVINTLKQIPAQASAAYGKGLRGFGILLLLLALRGFLVLTQRRQWRLLMILLLWPIHLGVYSITFFREGYFLLPFAIVFTMSAVGMAALTSPDCRKLERILITVVVLILILYGILIHNRFMVGPVLVFSLGLWIYWAMTGIQHDGITVRFNEVLGLSAIVLLLALQSHFTRPSRLTIPSFPEHGQRPNEKAMLFMQEHLPENALVCTYSLAPVVGAHLPYVAAFDGLQETRSDEEFMYWLNERHVFALFVDHLFILCEPRLWDRVQSLSGSYLSLIFTDPDGTALVYRVQDAAKRNPEMGSIPQQSREGSV